MVSRLKIGPCSVFGCGKPSLTDWLCPAHYKAKLRHGDATINKRSKPEKKCAVEGCEKLTTSVYCNAHRARFKRYDGRADYKPPAINGGPCKIEGCRATAIAHGLCSTHSRRLHKFGDPMGGRPLLTSDQVALIQRNPKQLSPQTLADLVGTTQTTVVAIQAGRNWGYLRT